MEHPVRPGGAMSAADVTRLAGFLLRQPIETQVGLVKAMREGGAPPELFTSPELQVVDGVIVGKLLTDPHEEEGFGCVCPLGDGGPTC